MSRLRLDSLASASRVAMPPQIRRAALTAAAAALLAACFSKRDPYFCEGQPNNACQQCTGDSECPTERPACDLSSGESTGTCVQCTPESMAACGPSAPFCGADHTCRACRAHSECSSRACLPDGTCARAETVAYAETNGADSAPCTLAAPCRTIGRALSTARPVLKLAGTFPEPVVIEGGRVVTLLAEPQATLAGSGTGPNLTVRGAGTSVTVQGLVIARAPATLTGYGIFVPPAAGKLRLELIGVELRRNPAGGVSVSSGHLVMTRSQALENNGGGIYVSGGSTTFVITDNVFAYNGRARAPVTSTFGGVAIFANTEGSRFERNTVAFNESDGMYTGGMYCAAPLVSAAGNVLYHNGEPDGLGGVALTSATQLGPPGGCAPATSLILPTHASHLGFRAPLAPPYDFHLTAESPAVVLDAGGPCSGTDIDGEERPQGAACDLGADELAP